jgi:predicted enzyme related to lactoylglutathione lyase
VPARETAPIGAPCWVDLMTSDVDRSRAFYTELFGWTAQEPAPEFGGYFNFAKDGVLVAGCMSSQPGEGVQDVWSVYLASDDARKTVETATANGGHVIANPVDVGDLGTMAVVTDPGGAAIGMWQPGLHKGFGIFGEPGTPAWFELHTRDYDAAVAFYREVFRWDAYTAGDTPEFRYTTLGQGDDQLAGIMDASAFMPEGAPAGWSIYFRVENADAALAKIVELGGSVVAPAEDTPYGRLATAADPTGSVFRLLARD